MGLLFGRFGKKKEPKKEVQKEEIPQPKKDPSTLIRELDDTQRILDMLGSSGDKLLVAMEKSKAEELRTEIIDMLSDEFQKKVLKILIKHKFDLLDFVGKDKDWKEEFRAGFKDIAFYLDPKHPLNFVKDKLPIPGKDLLFWMLQQAKNGKSENGYVNIGKALLAGEICGHRVNDRELIQSIFLLMNCVFFSKEYGFQFVVLMDIMREIEEGEEFIREEFYNKTEENFFEAGPSFED
jgi:hypothetical protein